MWVFNNLKYKAFILVSLHSVSDMMGFIITDSSVCVAYLQCSAVTLNGLELLPIHKHFKRLSDKTLIYRW